MGRAQGAWGDSESCCSAARRCVAWRARGVLAAGGELIQQRAAGFQCHHAMLMQAGGDEGVADAQHALLAGHFGLEGAADHIGDLVVLIMGMRGADGTLVELHQHGHQAGRVAHDLAADAVAQLFPGRRGGVEKQVHAGSPAQRF